MCLFGTESPIDAFPLEKIGQIEYSSGVCILRGFRKDEHRPDEAFSDPEAWGMRPGFHGDETESSDHPQPWCVL